MTENHALGFMVLSGVCIMGTLARNGITNDCSRCSGVYTTESPQFSDRLRRLRLE